MKINATLIALSFLGLFACEQKEEAPGTSTGTLTLRFDGQTKVYNDARLSEGKLGNISSISFTAGSTESDYLDLTVFGTEAGTYPYKQKIADYHGVSQVEYKTWGKLFNNYFTKICPAEAGYYSTTGQIKIDEYVAGKHAKGTFSGPVLDSNSQDECHPASKTFSGEFDITMN